MIGLRSMNWWIYELIVTKTYDDDVYENTNDRMNKISVEKWWRRYATKCWYWLSGTWVMETYSESLTSTSLRAVQWWNMELLPPWEARQSNLQTSISTSQPMQPNEWLINRLVTRIRHIPSHTLVWTLVWAKAMTCRCRFLPFSNIFNMQNAACLSWGKPSDLQLDNFSIQFPTLWPAL